MFLFALLGLASASVQIEPLYWNASNPIFAKGQSAQLEVNVGEKLDIYCPQRINQPLQPDQPLYLKGFLVSQEDFKSCVVRNAAEAKKIFTCNTPDQEKKHTILFQEINPNPFGLTFHRGEQYFLISTADGTANGIGSSSGGVCDRHNMKIQIRVSEVTDTPITETDSPKTRSSMKIQPLVPWDTREIAAEMEEFESEELEIDLAQSSGFTIGIVIGAFTVLFLIIAGVVGYRWHNRRGDIRKALYIPRPRPASSQVHLTLVPAGTSYPYDNTRKSRPMSGILGQNGAPQFGIPPSGNIYNPAGAAAPVYNLQSQVGKKESPSGTYSSRQDSLGETSCGSEMTYLDPGSGGVVEV